MSTLKLKGSTSGEAQVTVASSAGTPTITLPTASINLATDGSDGQFLKTNGSGTLSFATVSTQPNDSVAKAWVGANSDGDSTIDSYNISSVTFTNNAEIVVQFDTDFANANYCVVTGGYRTDTDGATALAAIMVDDIGNHAAGQCSLKAITSNSGGTVAYATGVDYRFWAVFFGDQ